jgi:glycerol-3-phosphate acyltransferase PlsX
LEKDVKDKFTIIIDAMGGDFAPEEIIKGTLLDIKELPVNLIFVGKEDKIKIAASQNNLNLNNVKIVNSYSEVSMDESPSEVIKHKKDSSIYIGTQIASNMMNSAFLSAGNTGAIMACSLFNLKKIEGIFRPALAVVIPLAEKRIVLIDAGANIEVKPIYLKQFAIMGKIYCENIIKVKNPKIGLINVGTEEKKGNEILIESYNLLKNSNLNFIGNIEGRDIFEGIADVIVCDGLIGNVLIKSIEGIAKLFFSEIKKVLTSNFLTKTLSLGLKNNLKIMKKKFDYEEVGGALLLGVNGIIIKSHGSSKAKAISNALKVAYDSIKCNIINKIREEIKN